LELAEQLELLSCVLEFATELQSAEAAILKALTIREASNDSEEFLDALDSLVEFYVRQNKFEQAENYFLRALEVRKRLYGPLSEEVENEIEQYAAILKELDRKEEAEQLASVLHRCATCGPDDGHAKYAPDVETIISSIKEIESQGKLDLAIEAQRDALVKLRDIGDKQNSRLANSDPFRELKMRAHFNAYRWVKSSLAQLLRLKYENENESQRDLLIEAAEHFRNLLAESDNLSNRLHLILTILDLAEADDAYYEEFDKLTSETCMCATVMYSKALSMFRRQGSTKESRAAMKAAFDFNRYVIEVFGTGCSAEDVPNHFSFGDKAEAQGYYLEASRQWNATPGGVEFMIEVMTRSLPASLRRNINRNAPPSIAQV
jgi:tetratricopeptide (TPR) repeat protein